MLFFPVYIEADPRCSTLLALSSEAAAHERPELLFLHRHPLQFPSHPGYTLRGETQAKTRVATNSFRINTSESVSKQTALTLFRMNTYEKPPGGWGVTGATARPYEGPEEESFGEPSFQTICRSIPSHNSASPSDSLWRRNKRRSFSRVISSERVLKEPLARRISSSIPVMRSRSPAVAGLFLSATRAARGERASSYKLIATACPKFTDRCSSRVGMRIRKSQWLRSSFERPNFSEPNKSATLLEARRLRIARAPSCRPRMG